MIIDDRNDAILVKIIYTDSDSNKKKYVASYFTTAIDQTLKMFITARDYHISCNFNEFSDVVEDEFKNFPDYTIEQVKLSLGSVEDLPVIEVWI